MQTKSLKYNDCYKYAVIRNLLYRNSKNIEILVSYEPKLHYMIEWWKQLFGESEGKDEKEFSQLELNLQQIYIH